MMIDVVITNIISNSPLIALLVWIALTQIRRIDNHENKFADVLKAITLTQTEVINLSKRTDGNERKIEKVLEIISNTQKDIASIIERTKYINQ